MSQFVEKTIEFNQVATGNSTSVYDPNRVRLYLGLLLEELGECFQASGSNADIETLRSVINQWSNDLKTKTELTQVIANGLNREKMLDGAIDVAVVAIGLAHSLGCDVVAACEHVADSNLSKFPIDANGHRYAIKDANGKVKKGESYFEPKLGQFLFRE